MTKYDNMALNYFTTLHSGYVLDLISLCANEMIKKNDYMNVTIGRFRRQSMFRGRYLITCLDTSFEHDGTVALVF